MNITDVKIRKISSEDNKLRAVVSMTLDNSFVVHDIKVIKSQEKLFIAMPSRRMPDGEYRDIAHPINGQTRQAIEAAIISEYEKAVENEEVMRASRETEAVQVDAEEADAEEEAE